MNMRARVRTLRTPALFKTALHFVQEKKIVEINGDDLRHDPSPRRRRRWDGERPRAYTANGLVVLEHVRRTPITGGDGDHRRGDLEDWT